MKTFLVIALPFIGFAFGLIVSALCNASSNYDKSHYWWDDKDIKG